MRFAPSYDSEQRNYEYSGSDLSDAREEVT